MVKSRSPLSAHDQICQLEKAYHVCNDSEIRKMESALMTPHNSSELRMSQYDETKSIQQQPVSLLKNIEKSPYLILHISYIILFM